MKKFKHITDDELAAALRARGWKVYPADRIRIGEAGMVRYEPEWEAMRCVPAAVARDRQNVAAILARHMIDTGAIVFQDSDHSAIGMSPAQHRLRAVCAMVMPKEVASEHTEPDAGACPVAGATGSEQPTGGRSPPGQNADADAN